MMVFGATGATADDVDLGLPPARRMSSSADGPLGKGRGRGGGRGGAAAAVPETAVLVLGNFQGVVVLDMGVVTVGDGKTATLRIEAPEIARKPVTTIGVDPRHPLTGGLGVNFDGELSLARGESHEAEVTWQPECGGKIRANVAFKVDGRFPAQVSVVGEAVDIGGGGGKGRGGDARKGRRRATGSSAGADGGRRRSLSQEAASRGSGPYTSMYGKENRLSLSSVALPPAPSVLGSSTSALTQGTTNKRQQMLMYSKSRRLSLKPTHRRGKSESAAGAGADGSGGGGRGGGSKAALLRKSLNDKGWAEKQTEGFTNWLNFTLVGADQLRHGGDGGEEGEEEGRLAAEAGVSSSPLKAMVAMRHEARQRMRAMMLFRSAEVREVAEAVSDRAHDGTLSLRSDRVLHADVGLSGALVDLVLCYEPRWLVLGLGTVFGEIVPMPPGAAAVSSSSSSSSSAKSGGRVDRALRTFVSERLVKCPEIKAKYGFRGRVASGWSEVDYNDELARHALTSFLNLVLFLDRAKAENLLHPCPCLFRKTAEVKSSVRMLEVFCQFLHGEGDFVRHLKKMGYVVGHVQSYIDEFDFRVGNLAVDLRDGVRLTRLMEVVTGEWDLAAGLRVPAGSRLQKIFNTKRALERLERDAGPITLGTAGADANGGNSAAAATAAAGAITPAKIVEGDRHATLRLLWFIITRYSLSALLDRDALAREVEGVITAARKWRRAGYSPARPERAMRKTGAAAAAAAAGESAVAGGSGDFGGVMSPGSPASPISPPSGGRAVAGEEHPPLELPDVDAMREGWAGKEGGGGGRGSGGGSASRRGDNELLAALLAWCQAVCHGYGVPVRNFTTSFADGRALCLLLHYYHPRIIPLNAIRRTTAHLPRIGGGGGGGELEDWSASLDASKITEAECKAALDGERANVALARHCVGELGGVPSMLAPFDSTNRPEEKTIITVVAHLCARLLESSAEIRSTILVQRVYRSFLERTGRGDLVERARAAKARARAKAAADRAAAAAAAAATAAAGGHGAVPCTPPTRRGSGSGAARPLPEQTMYVSEKQRTRLAAVTIQRWWAAGAEGRLRRLGQAAAATAVQAAWRGGAAREALRAELAEQQGRRISEAAVRIQAAARGRRERQAFLVSKKAATVLQVWVRGRLQRRWYLALIWQLSAVVRLQALARGIAGRRKAAAAREVRQMQARASLENSAATAIQAWWRLRSAQQRFSAARQAAVRIQSFARGKAEAGRYRRARAAIVAVQALQRGADARARASRERASRVVLAEREAGAAAVTLQALGRGVLARVHRRREDAAAAVLQARLRGVAGRTRAAERRAASFVMQRWGRFVLEELRYKGVVRAACVLQAWGRGVVARRRLAGRRAAAVRVQAWARGALEAARFRRGLRAAVALQALQRGAAARAGMAARHGAAVRVQAVARGRKEASLFRGKRAAAVGLQAWARAAAARGELARCRRAAVVVQAWWRGASAAGRFRRLARAAVVVQARARAAAAVARYRRAVEAVEIIQSHWRGAAAVARYRKDVRMVVSVQARWRAALGASRYRRIVAAVLTIQSALRGTRSRRHLARRERRATHIQAWWRMVTVRALAREQESSAVKLQAALRGMAARATYRRAVNRIVLLQALSRGNKTRALLGRERREAAELEAAILAARVRDAAVAVQAWHRGRAARKRRAEAEQAAAAARAAAAVRVQAAVRGVVARRAVRAAAAAATVVQACARGRRARGDLCRRRAAAVRVQSVARAASARARAGRVREERRAVLLASVAIQRAWRGVAARAMLSRRTAAAVTVQRWWRSELELSRLAAARAAAAEAQQAALEQRAAVSLQAFLRGHLARAVLRREAEAAVAVQARWRGAVVAARYRKTRAAAAVLQTLWRGAVTRTRLATEAEIRAEIRAAREESSAMTLQAFARGVLGRAELRRAAAAAATVQGAWRRRQARLLEERARALASAAVVIQAWWRMVAARTEGRRARRGAVALQAIVRGRAARGVVQARRCASTRIAAWWRAAAEAGRYRRTRRQVVIVQSLLRGRLGRGEVAARWLALGRRFSKHKAATMIQAAARGKATRRRTGPGITSARARIEKANANAIADPSQILGTRVNDALIALEHCTHLTAIIRACIALELTSRYSKVCCEVMARSRCPQVLYDLIRGLNRSPPHQKILKYAITTFRNIAQRGDNLPALLAAPPVAAETYVDLLQMYRERQEVFLPTVRLLQQLVAAHKPTKDECNTSKHAPRLESLRDILARKAAVEAKSSAARGGAVGGSRSARSLKAIELLLDELARE